MGTSIITISIADKIILKVPRVKDQETGQSPDQRCKHTKAAPNESSFTSTSVAGNFRFFLYIRGRVTTRAIP